MDKVAEMAASVGREVETSAGGGKFDLFNCGNSNWKGLLWGDDAVF
jgi:hypothetical protein